MSDTRYAEGRWFEHLPFSITRGHVIRFLISLAIATFLWGWVMQMTDPIMTRNYREMEITLDNLDGSLMMITTLPTAIVKIEGPESELNTVNRTDLQVVLDTTGVNGPGEYRLPLLVNAPNTSAEISVEPDQVLVQIDELVAQVMPIDVQNTVADDDPRTVSDIVPEVSQVTVSGPSSAVNRVAKVALPVSLDNRNETFTDVFTPYAIDNNGQRVSEVTVLPSQISTVVEMESRGKVVSVIPVVTGVPAEGVSVQQRAVFPDTIVVDGPAEALDSLLFVNTEPVDITGATSSVSEMVGLADLPAGVTVVDPPQGEVEVRVALEDISSSEQSLPSLPVLAVNVPEGYAASVEPRTINITVDGPSAVLAEMESSDVRVLVDVGGLEPGTHDLTPQVILPQGITWTSTTPEQVEVTITPMDVPSSTPAAVQPIGTRHSASPIHVIAGRQGS
jgi:YbbR domain-containing protein